MNKSSAVNETHPVSANTKYTVRDSVVRHTSSTLSRAASLASLRLRVSVIRILRVDSPLRFFIDLIVSVFQCVRPSVRLLPLTGKMPGRFQTLPPGSPALFLQIPVSAH